MNGIKRAATAILLGRHSTDASIRIMLVKRSSRTRFMPNFYVFPGGVIDPHDSALEWNQVCSKVVKSTHFGRIPERMALEVSPEVPSDRIGVLREVFEETGILLARPQGAEHHHSKLNELQLIPDSKLETIANVRPGASIDITLPHISLTEEKKPSLEGMDSAKIVPAHELARRIVHNDGSQFLSVMSALGLVPTINTVYPFARWITPADEPKRYDTLFYLAPIDMADPNVIDSIHKVTNLAVEPQQAQGKSMDAEVSLPLWLDPAEALEMSSTMELTLSPPTVYVLSQLAAFKTVDELLHHVKSKLKSGSTQFLEPWLAERYLRPDIGISRVSDAANMASEISQTNIQSSNKDSPVYQGRGFVALPGDIAHIGTSSHYKDPKSPAVMENMLPLSDRFTTTVPSENGPYHRIVLSSESPGWRVVTSNKTLIRSDSVL